MEKFLNILYPKRCPVCHGILSDRGNLICPSCEGLLHPIVTDYCLKCGKPIKSEEELCGECRKSHREFDRGRSVFFYNDKMRQSLLRYKYYGNRDYAEYYAVSLCRYMEREIRMWKPDLIVPVPIHKTKLRMRGFNQAAFLAEKLSSYTGIPVRQDLVLKIRKTKSQKKLNAVQRRKNLEEAFQVNEDVQGKRILVVDDVYTTGSTVDAMASCLKKKGASAVYFLTVCIGRI